MEERMVSVYINAENEQSESVITKAVSYEKNGADSIFIYNYTGHEEEKDEFLYTVKKITKALDIPVVIGYTVKRFEDIKKALYTGAEQMVLPYRKLKDIAALEEGIKRFGKDKILVEFDDSTENNDGLIKNAELAAELYEKGVAGIVFKHFQINDTSINAVNNMKFPVYIRDSFKRNDIKDLLSIENVKGTFTDYFAGKDIRKVKNMLEEEGINTYTFKSSVAFSEFKLNADGMIPVIVQDYKSSEVLMLAYMNEEAFNKTLVTGRMHYYSRSRQELWLKGETSGHFQFVKSLSLDCDNDTLLAKVKQVGAACHTGSYSCFFKSLLNRGFKDINIFKILDEDYKTIKDRKENPKEGSYTNYLFDKGIDKILKKCGEEATEITIAAKNPQAEELKYEIADYLYHLMVLMAECGVDWDDIACELYNRRG